MSVQSRLRALDHRVLGRPKPATPTTHRNGFTLGVVCVLALLLLAVLTGETSFLVAGSGFLGLLIGSGVRWWKSEHARRQTMRIGVAGGAALVLGAAALTGLTYDSWADPRTPQLPPDFGKAKPTVFVQCDATAQGRAYAYQPSVDETPRCENGAKPRVLLRP